MKRYIFVAGFFILLLAATPIFYTFIETRLVNNAVKASEKQPTIVNQLPATSTVVSKSLLVFDGNGIQLGVYAFNPNPELQRVFVPNLSRFIDLQVATGTTEKTVDLLFTSNNCSGIPYYVTTLPAGTPSSEALNTANGHWQMLLENNKRYYSIDKSEKVIATRLHSSLKDKDVCKSGDLGDQNVIPGTEVSLPFSLPVKLPLEVKYE